MMIMNCEEDGALGASVAAAVAEKAAFLVRTSGDVPNWSDCTSPIINTHRSVKFLPLGGR